MKKLFLANFLLAFLTTVNMTIVPILAVESLGLSLALFGLIEGGVELISNVSRFYSGYLFDKIKDKKMLFVLPSIGFLLSKLLLFSPSALTISLSKAVERISSGAFASPRNAYVLMNSSQKGGDLSFMSACKTVGCFVGPVFITFLVYFLGDISNNIYNIIFLSLPVNIVVIWVLYSMSIQKMDELQADSTAKETSTLSASKILAAFSSKKSLWLTLFVFFLARFNDGFLILYLKNLGVPEWFYISTIAIFNLVMAFYSVPLGRMLDKKYVNTSIFISILSLMIFNLCFYGSQSSSIILPFIGLVFWGVQRIGAAVTFDIAIAGNADKTKYGTYVGFVALVSSFGTFIAASIAGQIAQFYSMRDVFKYSFFMSTIALMILTVRYLKERRAREQSS